MTIIRSICWGCNGVASSYFFPCQKFTLLRSIILLIKTFFFIIRNKPMFWLSIIMGNHQLFCYYGNSLVTSSKNKSCIRIEKHRCFSCACNDTILNWSTLALTVIIFFFFNPIVLSLSHTYWSSMIPWVQKPPATAGS